MQQTKRIVRFFLASVLAFSTTSMTLTTMVDPNVADATVPVAASRIVHKKPVAGAVLREYTPPSKRWLAGHRGVDMSAEVGTAVYASAAGVVTFSGAINGMTSISITHADGIRTTYQPVDPLVNKGARVAKGQVIARLARSPRHPEPGLHWGALRGRDYLDPMSLLRTRTVVLKPL